MVVLKMFHNTFKLLNRNTLMTFQRQSSSCTKLAFRQFGDPLKVLKLEEETLSAPKADEVLVKFLVAPVNPADINLIQGVYPVKVELPAVGGIEGVGEVVEVGASVNNFKPGDWIVPNIEGFGTWRTFGVFKSECLFKERQKTLYLCDEIQYGNFAGVLIEAIPPLQKAWMQKSDNTVPNDLDAVQVGGLSSNPVTAYRMLKDFVNLKPGDVVIQNGGNSACGQNVIQICRINNFISVSVVRDRPEINGLKSYLESLGADYVLTEEELRKTDLFKTNKLPKPNLAFNCVGGRSATEISRHLADNGTMVTYGGMSREPVTIPTSAFIFKNISFRGYWMTRWTRLNKESQERRKMFDDLCDYMRSGKLKAPEHELIPLSNFPEAIMKTSSVQGYTGCKYLLDLQKSN